MTWTVIRLCCTIIALSSPILVLCVEPKGFKIATFDTAPHDGLRRFLWSANISNIDVDIIQKSDPKKSDPTLIGEYLGTQNPDSNVMFCDSKFLSVVGSSDDIIERWKRTKTAVLLEISKKGGIWGLKCILGSVKHLAHIMKAVDGIHCTDIGTIGNDQSYYEFSSALNKQSDFSIGQDEWGLVFLNMDKHPNMVGYTSDKMHFHNFNTNDAPPMLIGSTESYIDFNRLTNYVPGIFNKAKVGVRKRSDSSEYNPISFYMPDMEVSEFYKDKGDEAYPVMVTAFYIKEDTPYLDMVIDRYKSLSWLPSKRVLMILSRVKHREHIVEAFLEGLRNRNVFMKIIYYNSSAEETSSVVKMHTTVVKTCLEYKCTWIWNHDSSVVNIQFKILEEFAMLNFSIVAPMVLSSINDDTPSVNFWGGVAENGFYARSVDYFDIAYRKLGGIFVVPYITGAYLVRAELLKDLSYEDADYRDGDADIVFCNSVRRSGHLMYLVANKQNAVFINGRSDESHAYPFFEHFLENRTPFYLSYYMRWDHYRQREYKYNAATPTQNPCEDVFVLEQLFTDKFVANAKNGAYASDHWTYRVWHKDWDVLETLSFDDEGIAEGWEAFSKDYIPTIVDRKFKGFRSESSPTFSFYLRMTNDSTSTEALEGGGLYTVLVSLSDYDGGGIYFNDVCKVSLQTGDLVIYPSRLTHRVRFVAPTNGTMLNIVSFYN